MTVIPTATSLANAITLDRLVQAVPLERYWQIINYSECAGAGVYDEDEATSAYCDKVWTKPLRDMVERALVEAQHEIEQQTSYFLRPRYTVDEEAPWRYPYVTVWGYVIEAGIEAFDDVALAEAVDHTADPAVVGPVATTVTDEDEIVVYHPGSDVPIFPSAVTIAAGNVTITIPRCRLVTEASADNPAEGWSYTDTGVTGPLEQTVDIKRRYTDQSTEATLVYPHHSTAASCCGCSCSEATADGCVYLRKAKLGIVDIQRATYSAGTWTPYVSSCGCKPEILRVSYLSGLLTPTPQVEDAIVRLAHSKMPEEVCGCDPVDRLWKRDTNMPEGYSPERIGCPFGLSDGAWVAWRFTQAMRLVRGGRTL